MSALIIFLRTALAAAVALAVEERFVRAELAC